MTVFNARCNPCYSINACTDKNVTFWCVNCCRDFTAIFVIFSNVSHDFCHFYRDFLLSLNMFDRFNRIPACDIQTDRWRTSCENIVYVMHTIIAWLKMNLLYLQQTATNLAQCWQFMVRRINTCSFVKCLKQRTSWRFPWGRQNRLVNSNWRGGRTSVDEITHLSVRLFQIFGRFAF